MSNTHTLLKQRARTPAAILQRASISSALFLGVLTGILLISRTYILPSLTHVEIDGAERNLQSLQEYRASLTSDIEMIVAERNRLVLPIQDPLYNTLKEEKHSLPDFFTVKEDLLRKAASFSHDGKPVIFIHQMTFDVDDYSVVMKGDVRNVGPRSMTVLAQFIQSLEELETAALLDHNGFQRLESTNIGSYSPFTFTLTLK